MAELIYHVSTDWKEVERLYNEIMKLNSALEKSNTDAPREEIGRLISKLDELKGKYEDIIQTTQQANDKLSDVFSGSSNNPYKGIEDNADQATKTISKSFDEVIGKVCELYDYIKETKDLIGSLTESSDVISKITDCMSELSDETKRQELNLSNQATQNTNILQQQQAGVMSMTQQNIQAQSLNEAAGERAAIEEEVKTSIDDTTSSIKEQTNVVRENTNAINEQKEETAEIGDEFSDAFQSEERAIKDKIEALKQLNKKLQESIANSSSDEECSRYENQYAINEAEINKLEDSLDGLSEKEQQVSDSAKAVFNIFKAQDTNGNIFRVMAESIEDSDAKIQKAKDSLDAFPKIMERISEKAADMRLNAYMTDEGEALVKQAESLSKSLAGKNGIAQMFGANGEEIGSNTVDKLSDIEEKLGRIHAEQKAIEEENEKQAEQQRILEEQAEKRAESAGTMRTRIMKAREEMIQLIEAGKKGTPEFMELAEKAGDMREEMQLANAYMSYFDDPNRGLTTLKVGLQGVAGAASLVTSTIGLFNEDSKKMMEIQTKVQSILGIVVGLETTYNLVKRTSVFMIAIEEAKTWALAKARGVQAAATTAATAAQEGLNAAMSKTPWGAIVAILVTLGAAIFAVTKALMSETDAEKKAREEKEAHIKAIKEQQESWARSVADSASKQIMSYRKLQDSWNKLGDDMTKKKKFVKDNQKAFNDLGFAVGGVTDAENLLVKNTDAVVDSIMARAKALAYQELMTENFKKQIEEQMKADQNNATAKGGQYSYRVKAGGNATDRRSLAYKNAREAGYTFMEGDTKDGKWTEQGARRINQYSSNYAAKQRAKATEEDKKRNKKYEDEQKKLTDKANKELEKERNKLANANIKTYEPKGNGDKGGGGKTAAELAQERKELMDKQAREQKRAEEDLEISTREAKLKQMEETSEKTIMQIKLNHDKEVLAIKRAYEDMAIKRVEAAKQMWEKDPKNKGKNFFESKDYLSLNQNTEEESINRDERIKAADMSYERSIRDRHDKELQSLYDFYKQYGALEDKRFAITQEYDKKIADARKSGDIWGAASLEEKKKQELDNVDIESIKAQIDWEGVFNNLDRYSGEFLEKIRTQLQAVLNDPNLDPDNAKVVSDALSKLDGAIVEKTGNTFRWINAYLLEQERLQKEAELAANAYNIAIGEQIKANLDLAESQSGVKNVVSRISGGKVDLSGKDIKSQSKESIFKMLGIKEGSEEAKELSDAFDKLAKSEQKASSSTKKVEDAEKKKESAEEKERQKTADKISGWLNGVNDNIQKYLGDLPNLLGSIGLGDLGDKVGKGLSGINDAAGAAADFASGNYIGAAFKGISAIRNIGSALGLSATGNAAEVAETTERLTKKNEDLIRAIESLTGIMDKSYGSKALSVYQKALESQESVNKNNMEILRAQMGYHSSHHSNAYYADDNEIRKYNAAAQEAMRIAGVKVSTVTGLQSIYNLTPEQLKAIKDFAPDLWRYLTEVGKYDKSEYWDAVVEQAGKTEELTERIMEKLTTTTEESVFSDFLNQLYALSDGSQEVFTDISKGWQEMVNKMVINNLVGEKYQDDLSKWRQRLYELNKQKQENKEAMTPEIYKQRLKELNEEYQDIVKKAQSDINEYKEAGIIASTDNFNQSATAKSISNISYDQANSLVGIGISTQAAVEQSRERLDIINTRFDEMFIHMRECYDVAADSRDILAGMAIHVEEIRDGVVDSLVPRIKNMDSELSRIRKLVEEQ